MLGNRRVIALCISRVHDEPNYQFVSTLNEKITEQGDCLFVYNTCFDIYMDGQIVDGEKRIYEIPTLDLIDAMIIVEDKIKDKEALIEFIQKVQSYHIPIVVVGNEYPGCIQIEFDYKKGFENVVRYVMDHYEPKTVHFFGNRPGCIYSLERENVLRDVLKEKNIYFDDSMISYGRFWDFPTEQEMEKILAKGELPDAFICANDIMAISVCDVLKRNGYRVPEDIVVSGFDGLKKTFAVAPYITTAKTNHEEISSLTADAIYKLLDHIAVAKQIKVEPVLVEPCDLDNHEDVVKNAKKEGQYVGNIMNMMERYLETERLLTGIVARAQVADHINQVATEWYNDRLHPMFCVLGKDCIEGYKDPLMTVDDKLFADGMYMLFDNSRKKPMIPHEVTAEDIYEKLLALSETRQAFIFTSLNYLHAPLGYICHFFSEKSMETYYQIIQVVGALNNAIGGFRNCKYQNNLRKQIEEIYKYDVLTGLYNRTGFMKEYDDLAQMIRIKKQKVTVVMADLDKLKYINDEFGHDEGDYALRMVADALKFACPENALCTRYGGDEMLAFIVGDCKKDMIQDAIVKYIQERNRLNSKPYTVSCSVGVYETWNFYEKSLDEIVKKVDTLMYQEKTEKKLVG